MSKTTRVITTRIGKLKATASPEGICELKFFKEEKEKNTAILANEIITDTESESVLDLLERELEEYFSGERQNFNVPLNPEGTDFQKKVWAKLLEMPYGVTSTYAQLATRMGDVKAVRAVAGANAKNKIMILIPCHRVNGAKGELTGYAGGLAAKKFLLELESGIKIPTQLALAFPE